MELKNKIQTGINEFQENTYFIANYLKCNLVTRNMIKDLIDESGKIEGTGVFVLVRYDVPDNECHIGMGDGPTFSIVSL